MDGLVVLHILHSSETVAGSPSRGCSSLLLSWLRVGHDKARLLSHRKDIMFIFAPFETEVPVDTFSQLHFLVAWFLHFYCHIQLFLILDHQFPPIASENGSNLPT
ncbi:hypothetical protein PIB30_032241 [Stylosanthes scabra]|uniref:Uncharacterized protein n=1 Tax=Stylosanthes scabra TaxID=79078 RepID=A0ABU6VC66_9FABA|nr:hypothetical protein [Stylosanthes scabra]